MFISVSRIVKQRLGEEADLPNLSLDDEADLPSLASRALFVLVSSSAFAVSRNLRTGSGAAAALSFTIISVNS